MKLVLLPMGIFVEEYYYASPDIEVLLVIQRVADGCVLCASGISDAEDEDETINNPRWLNFAHIPDGYDFFAIPIEYIYDEGPLSTDEQSELLLRLVTQYTDEQYEIGQLRFLMLSGDTPIVLPTMLQ